ncbi:hypothetical protein CLV47_12115 [Antricoccus suffuscus]|uniref:Uncharacterized protein n=1 Tax=Antricoccus suffuscus TaxID=1629062 RepID=A0A2T0ZJR5_9ACTN|nr:hypothetical protein CLV47_12115 [Antricoccus suffuscus]
MVMQKISDFFAYNPDPGGESGGGGSTIVLILIFAVLVLSLTVAGRRIQDKERREVEKEIDRLNGRNTPRASPEED